MKMSLLLLALASSAMAQAPDPLREALAALGMSGGPIIQVETAAPSTGLRTASLQSSTGVQPSAGLNGRGAAMAQTGRTPDGEWRRMFPRKPNGDVR